MRTLSDDEKRFELEQLLRTLPRPLCRDPMASAALLAEHPIYRRWTISVPDPLRNHG